MERERAEAERLRTERERGAEEERLRIDAERAAEAERAGEVERVRLEQERVAQAKRLRIEKEKAAEAEKLRLEQERDAEAERLRLEHEKVAEAKRLRLEQEREAEAEGLRVEQEKAAEAERLRREKEQAAEAERLQMGKERADEERLRHGKAAEADRVRLAEERAMQERAAQERVRIQQERSANAERLGIERERAVEAQRRFEEAWAQPDLSEGTQSVELGLSRTQEVAAQLDEARRSQDAIREPPPAGADSSFVPTTQDGHSRQPVYLPSWAVTTEAPKKRARWLVAALVLVITVTGLVVVAMRFTNQQKPSTAELKTNPPFVTPPNMVYVPGGEFVMGAEAGDEYEKPAHKVLVKPFLMDTYEVTCEDYDKFLKATGRKAPPSWVNGAYAPGAARKPVTGVNWDDANAYAQWAKKRLPTEEEWEFAARGSDESKYPWGKDWKQGQANANNASRGLADVGKFEARSPQGLADMIGNAWEWTASSIHSYKGGQIPEDQLSEADRNKMKVIRGGCYLSNPEQATATYRRGWPPPKGPLDFSQTGFRCAHDAPGKN